MIIDSKWWAENFDKARTEFADMLQRAWAFIAEPKSSSRWRWPITPSRKAPMPSGRGDLARP